MIQNNRLNDKEKDVRGLKKQTSSLLNCAWQKGYVAGFDDGYKTGKQAEERPKGKWIITDDCEHFIAKCSICGRIEDSRMVKNYPFCHCGADMRGEA